MPRSRSRNKPALVPGGILMVRGSSSSALGSPNPALLRKGDALLDVEIVAFANKTIIFGHVNNDKKIAGRSPRKPA